VLPASVKPLTVPCARVTTGAEGSGKPSLRRGNGFPAAAVAYAIAIMPETFMVQGFRRLISEMQRESEDTTKS
jgi:hypothetical protein